MSHHFAIYFRRAHQPLRLSRRRDNFVPRISRRDHFYGQLRITFQCNPFFITIVSHISNTQYIVDRMHRGRRREGRRKRRGGGRRRERGKEKGGGGGRGRRTRRRGQKRGREVWWARGGEEKRGRIFFCKQKTAYESRLSLVGSERGRRDRLRRAKNG